MAQISPGTSKAPSIEITGYQRATITTQVTIHNNTFLTREERLLIYYIYIYNPDLFEQSAVGLAIALFWHIVALDSLQHWNGQECRDGKEAAALALQVWSRGSFYQQAPRNASVDPLEFGDVIIWPDFASKSCRLFDRHLETTDCLNRGGMMFRHVHGQIHLQ